MGLWIQPCAPYSDLAGKSAADPPHPNLALNGIGALKDAHREEHYTCVRCHAVFAHILGGTPAQQIWMLLNAGQHCGARACKCERTGAHRTEQRYHAELSMVI